MTLVASSCSIDSNEFTRFTKLLAYKSVQVIVESRKGIRVKGNRKTHKCGPHLFDIQISESPDVNLATGKALPSEKVLETIKSSFNIEISVRTEDGDEMALELWTLSLNAKQYDLSINEMNTIYFRMGILLKSLIAATRTTPAYYISRKQHAGSFVMFYKVYNGKPILTTLGISVKKFQVGLLKTPLGGLSFAVIYRTNLSMPSRKFNDSRILIVKDDHFRLSSSNMVNRIEKCKQQNKNSSLPSKNINLNHLMTLPAFADEVMLKKTCEDFFMKLDLFKGNNKRAKDTIKQKETKPKTLSASNNKSQNKPSESVSEKNIKELELPFKLMNFPFTSNQPMRQLAEFYGDFLKAPPFNFHDEGSNEFIPENLSKYNEAVDEFDQLVSDMSSCDNKSGACGSGACLSGLSGAPYK